MLQYIRRELTLAWAASGTEQTSCLMLVFILLVATRFFVSYFAEVRAMAHKIFISILDVIYTISCSVVANALPA